MANWTDDFNLMLRKKLGDNPSREELQNRYGWVGELHRQARELLEPEILREIPPQEIYSRLQSLSMPQCQIKMTNLGRMNDAEKIRDSIVTLITTKGNFAEKYRAAKFPQAGVVTITEILCIAKPMRFMLRNTAFTRGLAKVTPFYTKKALDELSYEELYDICFELAKVQQEFFRPVGLENWAKEHRFLLMYAILTD
jgi:hypothetical protein